MSCSVISDQINIVMDSRAENQPELSTGGSALQNPDLSRAKLGAMLRRKPRTSQKKTRNTFWSAFIACHAEQHANSND